MIHRCRIHAENDSSLQNFEQVIKYMHRFLISSWGSTNGTVANIAATVTQIVAFLSLELEITVVVLFTMID